MDMMSNNYDAFGNILSTPEMEVIPTRRAEVVDISNVKDVNQIRSPLAETLMTKHLNRSGMKGLDSTRARNILYDFALKVGRAESSGNPKARNKPLEGEEASTATGLYQFLVGNADKGKDNSSLQTAVNRAKKRIDASWLDEVFKTGKVEDLTPDQQTVLFLGDILEKKGSDKLIKSLLDPNASEKEQKKAMYKIYLNLHHTKKEGEAWDPRILKNANREILGIKN
jgi:protein-tyrosine-phosphatase